MALLGVAKFDFEGSKDRELSFKAGDSIEILKQSDKGWTRGSLKGKKGWFPTDYVEIKSNPAQDRPQVPQVPPATRPDRPDRSERRSTRTTTTTQRKSSETAEEEENGGEDSKEKKKKKAETGKSKRFFGRKKTQLTLESSSATSASSFEPTNCSLPEPSDQTSLVTDYFAYKTEERVHPYSHEIEKHRPFLTTKFCEQTATSSVVMDSLFLQIESLLSLLLENQSDTKQGTMPVGFSIEDSRRTLELLQGCVVEWSKYNLQQFAIWCGGAIRVYIEKSPAKKQSKDPPSFNDITTSDFVQNDLPEYFLINTLVMTLNGAMELGEKGQKQFSEIPWRVIELLFESIKHQNPSPIREKATECLSVLSLTFLKKIVSLYIGKFASAKNETSFRESVTYLISAGYLEYGFGSDIAANSTIEFLESMTQFMTKEKGDVSVVRYAMCLCLYSFFLRLAGDLITASSFSSDSPSSLSAPSPSPSSSSSSASLSSAPILTTGTKATSFGAHTFFTEDDSLSATASFPLPIPSYAKPIFFEQNSYISVSNKFQTLLKTVFETVRKWLKKPRLRLPCLAVMGILCRVGSPDFVRAHGKLFLEAINGCNKEKELWVKCLGLLVPYFGSYPSELMDSFVEQVGFVSSSFFHKKANLSHLENLQLSQLISVIANKKGSILTELPLFEAVLTSNDYTTSQKGVMYQVFGGLLTRLTLQEREPIYQSSQTFQRYVSSQYSDEAAKPPKDQILAPILGDPLASLKAEHTSCATYLLQCFPDLCPPHLQEAFLSQYISLFWRTDILCEELIRCCTRYFLANPQENLPSLLLIFVDKILQTAIPAKSEDIVRLLSNFCVILEEGKKGPSWEGKKLIEGQKWVQARTSFDGVGLCFLVHDVPQVWIAIRNTAQLLGTVGNCDGESLLTLFSTARERLIEKKGYLIPKMGWLGLVFLFFDPKSGKRTSSYNQLIPAAWKYLQSRIAPPTSSLWPNHVRFLSFSFSEEFIPHHTIFASQLVSQLWNPSSPATCEVVLELRETLSFPIRPLCLECLSSEREERGKKKKSKGRDELYLQAEVISFLLSLSQKLPVVMFSSNQNVRSCYQTVLEVFLGDEMKLDRYSVEDKIAISDLIHNILLLQGFAQETIDKSNFPFLSSPQETMRVFHFLASIFWSKDSAKASSSLPASPSSISLSSEQDLPTETPILFTSSATSVFSSFSSLPLPSPVSSPTSNHLSKRQTLDISVVRSVAVLLEHGVFLQDQYHTIQSFLMNGLSVGEHLQEHVAEGMTEMLHKGKYMLQPLIFNTFKGDHAISLACLDSITRNFDRYLLDWMSSCSLEVILAVGLCHLCSPQPSARSFATRILNALASMDDRLDSGTLLPDTAPMTINTYMAVPLRYSAEIAKKNRAMASVLFRTILGHLAHLPDDYCRPILSVLQPWCFHLPHLIQSANVIEAVNMIDDMFALSKRFMSKFPELMNGIWISATANLGGSLTIEDIKVAVSMCVDTVLSRYTESGEDTFPNWISSEANPTMELCHLIIGSLSSSNNAPLLLSILTVPLKSVKVDLQGQMDRLLVELIEETLPVFATPSSFSTLPKESEQKNLPLPTTPGSAKSTKGSKKGHEKTPGSKVRKRAPSTEKTRQSAAKIVVKEEEGDGVQIQQTFPSLSLHPEKFVGLPAPSLDDSVLPFTPRQMAAFALCADVALNSERNSLAEHLPIMLQFGYTFFRHTDQFASLLKNTIRGIGCHEAGKLDLVGQLLRTKSMTSPSFIKELCSLLRALDPSIPTRWAILALDYCFQDIPRWVRFDCLQLFALLNDDFSLDPLQKVGFLTFGSLFTNNEQSFEYMCDVLDLLIVHISKMPRPSASYLVFLVTTLLSTGVISRYNRALGSIMSALARENVYDSSKPLRLDSLGEELVKTITGAWRSEKELCVMLVKGIANVSTFPKTMQLLTFIGRLCAIRIPVTSLPPNHPDVPYSVLLLLLSRIIQASRGFEGHGELAAVFEDPVSVASPILLGFREGNLLELLPSYEMKPRAELIRRFSECYVKAFPTSLCFQFSVEVLLTLLRLSPDEEECVLIFQLLDYLILMYNRAGIALLNRGELVEVVVFYIQCDIPQIKEITTRLFSYVVSILPFSALGQEEGKKAGEEKAKTTFFNLIRKLPSDPFYESDSGLFRGEDPTTLSLHTYRCLVQMMCRLFNLNPTSKTASLLLTGFSQITKEELKKNVESLRTAPGWWFPDIEGGNSSDGSSGGAQVPPRRKSRFMKDERR